MIEWFDLGGSLQLSDTMSANDVITSAGQVQGLVELARTAGDDASSACPGRER